MCVLLAFPFVEFSGGQFVRLSVSLCVCLCGCLLVRLCVCLFVCLLVCLKLYVCMYVCFCLFVCLYVFCFDCVFVCPPSGCVSVSSVFLIMHLVVFVFVCMNDVLFLPLVVCVLRVFVCWCV